MALEVTILHVTQDVATGVREIPRTTGSLQIAAVLDID